MNIVKLDQTIHHPAGVIIAPQVHPLARAIGVVNVNTGNFEAVVLAGNSPGPLAISPEGSRVYTTTFNDELGRVGKTSFCFAHRFNGMKRMVGKRAERSWIKSKIMALSDPTLPGLATFFRIYD